MQTGTGMGTGTDRYTQAQSTGAKSVPEHVGKLLQSMYCVVYWHAPTSPSSTHRALLLHHPALALCCQHAHSQSLWGKEHESDSRNICISAFHLVAQVRFRDQSPSSRQSSLDMHALLLLLLSPSHSSLRLVITLPSTRRIQQNGSFSSRFMRAAAIYVCIWPASGNLHLHTQYILLGLALFLLSPPHTAR